jgi:hypothetical protein
VSARPVAWWVSVSVPGRLYRKLATGRIERREPGSLAWVPDTEGFYGMDERAALPRAS